MLKSFGIPANCESQCSCSGIYKTRHITTPSERPDLSRGCPTRAWRQTRMRYHLVSASDLSGSTAAHIPAICNLFTADPPLTETPSRTMAFLGARLGNSGHKSREKKTSSPIIVFGQYQGSIWEILAVAHDAVPSSQGCFHYRHFLSAAGPTVR